MIKNKFLFPVLLMIALFATVSIGASQLNSNWQSEYDGASEHTIALYHFNQSQIYNIWNGQACNEIPGYGGSEDWIAYVDNSWNTVFSSGGKFGWGVHNSGGSGDDRVKVNDSENMFPTAADPSLTVECWVKFNDVSVNKFIIDKQGGYHDTVGYRLYYNADSQGDSMLRWRLGDGNREIYLEAQVSFETGIWYHVAGTWDADTDTSKLFVDGNELNVKIAPGSVIVNSAKEAVFANRAVSNYRALDGVIDEVRISDIAYEFNDDPAPPAAELLPDHPRLLFDANDIDELAIRAETTHTRQWYNMLSKCSYLRGRYITTAPRTDQGQDDDLRHFETDLATLAVVQLLDPNLPYQQTSIDYFWTIINWDEWDASYWNSGWFGACDTDLEMGCVLRGLSVWYDLQGHLLTPSQRSFANDKIIEIADLYRNEYWRFDNDTNGKRTGNHCWNAFAGLASVLYAADNIPASIETDWTDNLDWHYGKIKVLMNDYMNSGATGEGQGYWMWGLDKILKWYEMRRIADEPAFGNIEWFENTSTYGMYGFLPGGNDNWGGVIRYSDCHGRYWGNPYNIVPLLAKNLDDPKAQWMCTKLQHSNSDDTDVWNYLWFDPNITPVEPEYDLSNWHLFDDYGMFVWRSSWDDDAAYFTSRSGMHSHGHDKPDDGQFMLHRAGIPYIVNLGYAVPKYTKSSNVLLVDNTGQYSDGDDWGGVFDDVWPDNQDIWGNTDLITVAGKARDMNGDFFDVLCDPTNMYQTNKLTMWNREFVGLGDLFLLRDTIESSSSADFDLLIHSFKSFEGEDAYDDQPLKTQNPFIDLGGGKWELDVRYNAPKLELFDMSNDSWSSSIEQSWFYRKPPTQVNTRLGNHLKRTYTGTSASSLMVFGFDDQVSRWTFSQWSDSSAEGVHVTDSGDDVIDILWTVDGTSCTNSDGWDVTGKMAGRRYSQSPEDMQAAYFGREVTYMENDGQVLLSSAQSVSLHSRLETNLGFMQNEIVISCQNQTAVTLYCPRQPLQVYFDGSQISYNYANNLLTVIIPTCNLSTITVVTDEGPFSDIYNDGIVNLRDFAELISHWLDETTTTTEPADIFRDGKVDRFDLRVLIQEWLYTD